MSSYAKLIAGVLAVSGLSVALADDPISLDGMGSMMEDIGDADVMAAPAVMEAPVAAPAPAVAPVEEACPNTHTSNAAIRISAATASRALSRVNFREALAEFADVRAQAEAQYEYAMIATVDTHEVALKAVHAARLNLKDSMAALEPVLAERLELALQRAELNLSLRQP